LLLIWMFHIRSGTGGIAAKAGDSHSVKLGMRLSTQRVVPSAPSIEMPSPSDLRLSIMAGILRRMDE
jgi:hypothetical protein